MKLQALHHRSPPLLPDVVTIPFSNLTVPPEGCCSQPTKNIQLNCPQTNLLVCGFQTLNFVALALVKRYNSRKRRR